MTYSDLLMRLTDRLLCQELLSLFTLQDIDVINLRRIAFDASQTTVGNHINQLLYRFYP